MTDTISMSEGRPMRRYRISRDPHNGWEVGRLWIRAIFLGRTQITPPIVEVLHTAHSYEQAWAWLGEHLQRER